MLMYSFFWIEIVEEKSSTIKIIKCDLVIFPNVLVILRCYVNTILIVKIINYIQEEG